MPFLTFSYNCLFVNFSDFYFLLNISVMASAVFNELSINFANPIQHLSIFLLVKPYIKLD